MAALSGWIPRPDQSGLDRYVDGVVVESRDLTREEADTLAGIRAEAEAAERPVVHRAALTAAREILLAYRFGAPGTPTFPEVLSPVQTAVLDYRDSGVRDPECDEHIMWINARVNEINAAALYGAGVLK